MHGKELYPVQDVPNFKNSAPAHLAASIIAVIDTRTCIRDGLAQSLRTALEAQILAVSCIEDLTGSSFDIEAGSGTMIVYCDGAIVDRETVDRELRELRTFFPKARLVLLTDRLQLVSLDCFHQQIVDGVIPSSYSTDQLLACMCMVLSGIQFLPPTLLGPQAVNTEAPQNKNGKQRRKLTPRQHQIMQYIAVGKSNKYIAAELSLCESTVKVHVHEVMKRLGATSRTHASYILANDVVGD